MTNQKQSLNLCTVIDENLNTISELGASSAYPINTTGGSADAVVVSHTHGIPALSGTAASNGAHTHSVKSPMLYGSDWAAGKNAWSASSTGQTAYNLAGTAESSGAHTHSVTTNASTTGPQGVSGTGKNMPPYKAVYIWERTE